MESVNPDYLIECQPMDIPGLISFWSFHASGEFFSADNGEDYILTSRTGELGVVEDPHAPFGGKALRLEKGDWLSIPRAECPRLDIHGKDGCCTILAWIQRHRSGDRSCEFIAGQWNESNQGRQYGLFLNISVWCGYDQVTGHLSNCGGPTPGYRYCIDGPVGKSPVPYDRWSVVGMSYDGTCGYVWFDGRLDVRDGLNPYSFAGGLHDGGPGGSDFTIGAVDRSGELGNFFAGDIAGIAVYDRALSPAEIYRLSNI